MLFGDGIRLGGLCKLFGRIGQGRIEQPMVCSAVDQYDPDQRFVD
jgi:hypothetical protein